MSVFDSLVGQDRAAARLHAAVADPVHAYLFVGPRGSGKRRAASILAGELVGASQDRERNRRLAYREEHPDLVVFEPEGNSLRAEEADAIIVAASRSSVESGRKVIVVDRFHEATAEAAAKLLKPLEEPPASTIFVLLAEEVPPEHITISSRTTQVDFPSVPIAAIQQALVERGVAPTVAEAAAVGSGGDVSRAELLATDDDFASRRELWWQVPSRVDSAGYEITEIVGSIRSAIDEAQAPLDRRHAEEVERMDELESAVGVRGSGRKAMEVRHRREARAHRTDEWRMGLATLAHRYRSDLDRLPDSSVFMTLTNAAAALARNPNEELWLTALLLDLRRV